MKTSSGVQYCLGSCCAKEDIKPLSNKVLPERNTVHRKTVQAITDLFEDNLEERITKNRVPDIGEFVLVNERGGCFSREHGGRYEYHVNRRYFGRVTQKYPHIIVIETGKGLTSEKVSDIRVGLIQYVRLKSLPEHMEEISYDERLLSNFIKDFENFLLE